MRSIFKAIGDYNDNPPFIIAAIGAQKNYSQSVRVLFAILLFGLCVPLPGLATPICPAGYILNYGGLCEQKWQLETGNCPQGSYYDKNRQDCLTRCPYRSVSEVSSQGDYVCQKDSKREWLQEYTKKCADQKMQYLPMINMCLVPTKPAEPLKEVTECAEGTVWHMQNGVYSCVTGNPQKVMQNLKERLYSKGLSYVDYVSAMKDIQTNKLAAQIMQYRWEEAVGIRQTKAQQEAAILASTQCPEEYVPTAQGGCKHAKSCAIYGCPDGQVPQLMQDGKNQYCGCRPLKN